ncbi:MAG: YggT family protein [Candidatus Erginobacter occultus]|nr:YggT family protein [Candidatus Erginobacter occultus]
MMGLVGLLLSVYFILLLIRALVPDTGQITFNQPFRMVVKLTEPVVAFFARLLPPRSRRRAAFPALGAVILLRGIILMGDPGLESGIFSWGFTGWRFAAAQPFWGVGCALAGYLVLVYQLFALLLLVILITPDAASFDQVSRLIRTLLQPLIRTVRGRWPAAAALPLIFTAVMALLWILYGALGWVDAAGMSVGKTLVNSLVIPLRLARVIVYLIIFRAILSWFDAARKSSGPFAWLELFVEPFLRPFRRFNLVLGRIDLTPLAAIVAIVLARKIVETILFEIYRTL